MSEPIHLALNEFENRDPNRRGRVGERASEKNTRDQDRDADRILDTRRPRGFEDLAVESREQRDLRPRPVPEARTQEPMLPPLPSGYEARMRATAPTRSAPAPEQYSQLQQSGSPASSQRELPESAISSARPVAPLLPGAITATNTFEKYVAHIRQWLPYAQKILVPLLDGNIATAFGNLLNPQGGSQLTSPAVRANTEGLERSVAEVSASHRELRGQLVEQTGQLKRVEDQLERVREATDRNTLEQQELIEDLRAAHHRIRAIVITAVVLLLGMGVMQLYILFLLSQPR
jgi:chemotaxis protein histidine kinase CheA